MRAQRKDKHGMKINPANMYIVTLFKLTCSGVDKVRAKAEISMTSGQVQQTGI